jgi:hypothetical protein
MKRIVRAKAKTLRLLVAKLEAQAGGPVTAEYLRLADLVAMMLGVERKFNSSTGGHTGRPLPSQEEYYAKIKRETGVDHRLILRYEQEERRLKSLHPDWNAEQVRAEADRIIGGLKESSHE